VLRETRGRRLGEGRPTWDLGTAGQGCLRDAARPMGRRRHQYTAGWFIAIAARLSRGPSRLSQQSVESIPDRLEDVDAIPRSPE
jgi:hypothetical protein